MIFSQFEEAVWHRRGSDCDIAEAWHHGGEIVSAVEAVLEFGEVAGYMLVADGAVSASDGALDVAEGGVDPLESRVQGGLATGTSDGPRRKTGQHDCRTGKPIGDSGGRWALARSVPTGRSNRPVRLAGECARCRR